MFTGIIRHLGKITAVTKQPDEAVVFAITTPLSQDLNEGDSVAVNGVCLTVLKKQNDVWQARLMAETLKRTNLGVLQKDGMVNLERPLTVNQLVDGHLVQGHIDGVCKIIDITPVGSDKVFSFQPPTNLLPYLIPKGSVALDGVSLTVVDVDSTHFTVSIMPYTLEMTTFGQREIGDQINIEVDMISKYVKSFMDARMSDSVKRRGSHRVEPRGRGHTTLRGAAFRRIGLSSVFHPACASLS